MAVTKDERLQIRVDTEERRLIERGAAASHLSVSAFVVQSAAAHAASVLADRTLIELEPAAAEAFSRALRQPAEVNKRLVGALAKPRSFTWLD
jgi:uncharacterized protein (DUF1778 family)